MPEIFTGDFKSLFWYWQDQDRAVKFLKGGTREKAIDEARRFGKFFCGKIWADMGTGTGYVVKRLKDYFKPISIIGIDISQPMLRSYQVKEAQRVLATTSGLPLRNGSIGAVSIFFCLSDYPDLKPFFVEVARVLDWEGPFLFVDYAKGDQYWEARKAHHGEKGIVGNINLRTTEEVKDQLEPNFNIVHLEYVCDIVDSKRLHPPFQLPSKIERKFIMALATKK